MNKKELIEVKILAEQIRLESIKAMGTYGSGHVGGVLSAADVVAVLYGKIAYYDAKNPSLEDRDRIVLSKGHCGPVLYAALALKGFFEKELLATLNQNNTSLPSHCNMHDTPGIDVSTGSLGQGASLAAGLALGMKLKKLSSYTYLILGDGECNEGQVWEMALFAHQHKLHNLIAFIDLNHQQLDGYTDDICQLGDLRQKFENFGWNSVHIDGHDIQKISDSIVLAKKQHNKPTLIVLDTIKGKGWSVTEGKEKVHHVTINAHQVELACEEINKRIKKLELQLNE